MEFKIIVPITTSEELTPLLVGIQHASEVCMDTEADSLHHYFEKVCLLQFTLPGKRHFLVDPLAGLDLRPLFESLKDKSLVLHGADYDLRMLRADFDFVPSVIFDTMQAARFAGHTGLGLDALVKRYEGQTLDHGGQKADWSQRPLPPRLLKYAMEDTCHLPSIAGHLRKELATLGRGEWHRQQCRQLIESSGSVSARDPDEMWRIKGSFHLDRQSLAILRELWKWRDKEARHWNRPSFMVCGNDKLLELTAWARKHPHGNLLHGPPLPKRWPSWRLQNLSATLRQAWALPESKWPAPPQHEKRPPYRRGFTRNLHRLRAVRDAMAKSLKLDPSILAPNAMLGTIVMRHPKALEDFQSIEKWLPWQTELLGHSFLKELHSIQH